MQTRLALANFFTEWSLHLQQFYPSGNDAPGSKFTLPRGGLPNFLSDSVMIGIWKIGGDKLSLLVADRAWAGGGGLSWWIDCTRSREGFSGICEVEYSIGEAQKNRGSSTRVALLLFGTLMRECTISRGEDQHRPEKDVDTRSKEEEQQQQRWRWQGFWWAPGTGWRWQGFPRRRQSWCVGPSFVLLYVELQLFPNFLQYPSLHEIRDMDSNSSRIAANPPTVPPAREAFFVALRPSEMALILQLGQQL